MDTPALPDLRPPHPAPAWGVFVGAVLWLMLITFVTLISASPAHAESAAGAGSGLDAAVDAQVRQLALQSVRPGAASVARIELSVGRLDPRLRLAPCAKVEPYLPAGIRLWGKTRIGLRCTDGPTPWNVYLPITVKAYGRALVAAAVLPSGAVLAAADLVQGEVDLAEDTSGAIADAAQAVGRTLNVSMLPGQSLRQASLKLRQWFAAGETVKVLSQGEGFSVATEGQAVTPGIEGQPARVRTEGGRVLLGTPIGENLMALGP